MKPRWEASSRMKSNGKSRKGYHSKEAPSRKKSERGRYLKEENSKREKRPLESIERVVTSETAN